MHFTSKRFDVYALIRDGRRLFDEGEIPDEIPQPRGNYVFIAIITCVDGQFGQLLFTPEFYKELRQLSTKQPPFKISAIFSIHRTVMQKLPVYD